MSFPPDFPPRLPPHWPVVLLVAGLSLLAAPRVRAQTEVTAVLAGHALVPHDTTVRAPRDAGPFFATAGKFSAASRLRTEALGSVPANTFVGDPKYPRASGGALPLTAIVTSAPSDSSMLAATSILVGLSSTSKMRRPCSGATTPGLLPDRVMAAVNICCCSMLGRCNTSSKPKVLP